jgi:hypothetical protein
MRSTRRESLLAAALAVALMASTTAPYLLHARQPRPGLVYSGLERYLNDSLSYLMWINQTRNGAGSVTNLYMHDLPDRFAPHPLWEALGLLGRAVPIPTVVLFHAARLVLGLAFLGVLWRLAWRFARDRMAAWTAWALAATGCGLGWVHALVSGDQSLRGLAVSADYMPELWSYSSLLYFPHFAAALLLMALVALLLADAWERESPRAALGAGLCLGLLVLVHPYSAATLYAVLALHAVLWRVRSGGWQPVLAPALLCVAVSVPCGAFLAWQTLTHEALRRWSAANLMPSPAPLSYLLGFGLVGVLGLVGLARIVTRREGSRVRPDELFLVAWVLATVLLIYSSLAFERRCVEGLSLALCLLAAPVAVGLARRGSGRWAVARVAGFVLLCLPGSVWYLVRELPSREGYVAAGIPEAERVISQRFGPEAKVFCEGVVGQWLPAEGRLRVYVGHAQLTQDHLAKAQVVQRFFAADTPPRERLRIFRETGCDVVLAYGERAALLRGSGSLWREVAPVAGGGVFVPGAGV